MQENLYVCMQMHWKMSSDTAFVRDESQKEITTQHSGRPESSFFLTKLW